MHLYDRFLQFGKSHTFRDILDPERGRSAAPVLDDATVKTIDDLSPITVAGVPERIYARLPPMCRSYFATVLNRTGVSGSLFKNFIYCAKTPDDGLIIGVYHDDVKYVLIVWDKYSYDIWTPARAGIH